MIFRTNIYCTICYPKVRCCACRRFLQQRFSTRQIIFNEQFKKLYNQNGQKCRTISGDCCCEYNAIANVKTTAIDITLSITILINCCKASLTQADETFLQDIREIRNRLSHFSYTTDHTVLDFERLWNRFSDATKHFANSIGRRYCSKVLRKISHQRGLPVLQHGESLSRLEKCSKAQAKELHDIVKTTSKIAQQVDEVLEHVEASKTPQNVFIFNYQDASKTPFDLDTRSTQRSFPNSHSVSNRNDIPCLQYHDDTCHEMEIIPINSNRPASYVRRIEDATCVRINCGVNDHAEERRILPTNNSNCVDHSDLNEIKNETSLHEKRLSTNGNESSEDRGPLSIYNELYTDRSDEEINRYVLNKDEAARTNTNCNGDTSEGPQRLLPNNNDLHTANPEGERNEDFNGFDDHLAEAHGYREDDDNEYLDTTDAFDDNHILFDLDYLKISGRENWGKSVMYTTLVYIMLQGPSSVADVNLELFKEIYEVVFKNNTFDIQIGSHELHRYFRELRRKYLTKCENLFKIESKEIIHFLVNSFGCECPEFFIETCTGDILLEYVRPIVYVRDDYDVGIYPAIFDAETSLLEVEKDILVDSLLCRLQNVSDAFSVGKFIRMLKLYLDDQEVSLMFCIALKDSNNDYTFEHMIEFLDGITIEATCFEIFEHDEIFYTPFQRSVDEFGNTFYHHLVVQCMEAPRFQLYMTYFCTVLDLSEIVNCNSETPTDIAAYLGRYDVISATLSARDVDDKDDIIENMFHMLKEGFKACETNSPFAMTIRLAKSQKGRRKDYKRSLDVIGKAEEIGSFEKEVASEKVVKVLKDVNQCTKKIVACAKVIKEEGTVQLKKLCEEKLTIADEKITKFSKWFSKKLD